MKSFVSRFSVLSLAAAAAVMFAADGAQAQIMDHLGEVAVSSSALSRVSSTPEVNFTMPEVRPIEGINRVMFALNNVVNDYAIRPIGMGWNYIVPEVARDGINNFGRNFMTPFSSLQNILQGNFIGAGTEMNRFVVNSTAGILGFRDYSAVPENKQTFANTLGVWGICPLVHMEFPIIEQTTSLRDMTGNVSEGILKGVCTFGVSAVVNLVMLINNAEMMVDKRNAVISSNPSDPYIGVRDTYESARQNRIIQSSVFTLN
ncbi:VacJ family lipoprotein [Candidatus Sumerlaeota bacterium]|nr:MlaA family lipoprotein [Candidatus Sumerlaeales bacterium]NLD60921.1 VacJ family lipoprotein [Candidatus Sumerlaeota bacterium]